MKEKQIFYNKYIYLPGGPCVVVVVKLAGPVKYREIVR